MSSLTERLKMIRESLGVSKREMSRKLDIAGGSWQAYEEGNTVPGGKVLEALAQEGYDINWLLTGNGEMLSRWHWTNIVAVEPSSTLAQTVSSSADIDEDLLAAVVEAVEEYLDQINGHLPPAKMGQLVAALYKLFSAEEEKKVDKATVISLVKLAA